MMTMSDEERLQQRNAVVLELDRLKSLVVDLTERNRRNREAFKSFADSFVQPGKYPVITGDSIQIGTTSYSISDLEPATAIARRKEFEDAQERLAGLQQRAAALGIHLS